MNEFEDEEEYYTENYCRKNEEFICVDCGYIESDCKCSDDRDFK